LKVAEDDELRIYADWTWPGKYLC